MRTESTPSAVEAMQEVSIDPSDEARSSWRENKPSFGWFPRIDPDELWIFRELALFLALRDLKVRYKQTALGVAWAMIQPLAGLAVFSIVFGRLADLPSDGLPYTVFAYAGLIAWSYFATSVSTAAESLVGNRTLVTKIYFPRVLAPTAAVFPALVDLGISLLLIGILMVILQVTPTFALALIPLCIIAGMFVALGAGLWLSALNVIYRDVRYALTFLIQVWFFASPVIFPSSLFEGWARYLFALNPMVGVIDIFRSCLIGAPAPPIADLVSLATAVLLFATGLVYFGRVERRFADVI